MLELLRTRRSIRKYTNKKIEPEKIEKLKQAAILSPTGKNKQENKFVFIEDKEILKKLSEVKPHGGKMLKDAALAIVVAADETESDVWIEDSSVAATTIHYTAHSLGLGSCWVQIRNRMLDYEKGISSEELVHNILNLPENIRVLCIISIGYAKEERPAHELDKLDYSSIKYF